MRTTLRIGNITVAVLRKNIKHVHLSVHPPGGRVTLVAPRRTRIEVVRAYLASKVAWIRRQQAQLRAQARESRRAFVERESHYLWGRRYLLALRTAASRPSVSLGHRTITMTVRPGATREEREVVIHRWHREVLHEVVPRIIAKWEPRLGVKAQRYFLQRMRTKWGSCNHRARHVRLNTELVKKPKELLEYVVVHELLHLKEPTHGERFMALLDKHYPHWREARVELNELPLGS